MENITCLCRLSAITQNLGCPRVVISFFLISKKKYIKRTSRKQEANERVQRGTQTTRKHKRKQKANRAEKTKYNEEN